MSVSTNVFMANYITRNMKNLTTWQFVPSKIGKDFDMIKYEPTNESIYAELFMSSIKEVDEVIRNSK